MSFGQEYTAYQKILKCFESVTHKRQLWVCEKMVGQFIKTYPRSSFIGELVWSGEWFAYDSEGNRVHSDE